MDKIYEIKFNGKFDQFTNKGTIKQLTENYHSILVDGSKYSRQSYFYTINTNPTNIIDLVQALNKAINNLHKSTGSNTVLRDMFSYTVVN